MVGAVLAAAGLFLLHPTGAPQVAPAETAPADTAPVDSAPAAEVESASGAPREADLAGLRAAVRDGPEVDPGRSFSLRQIREIEAVRSPMPAIEVDTVGFASGSAAIPPEAARGLLRLGVVSAAWCGSAERGSVRPAGFLHGFPPVLEGRQLPLSRSLPPGLGDDRLIPGEHGVPLSDQSDTPA